MLMYVSNSGPFQGLSPYTTAQWGPQGDYIRLHKHTSEPADCTLVTKQMTSASDKQMNMSDLCCHSVIPLMYKCYALQAPMHCCNSWCNTTEAQNVIKMSPRLTSKPNISRPQSILYILNKDNNKTHIKKCGICTQLKAEEFQQGSKGKHYKVHLVWLLTVEIV